VKNTAITICIVEADGSARRSLLRLMQSHGFRTLGFRSAVELLASPAPEGPACVIVGDTTSGDGAALPRALRARALPLPVILLTACGSEDRRAEAKKAGVAACFLKPVDDQALVDAIDWALSSPLLAETSAANSGGEKP
jgi:FixJ family two-component response regulator